MGISGLLPFLKNATESVNIRQFEGSVVAIDTYCWIYKGAFSCAEQLALGQAADGHIKYVLKYVQKLLEWNIKPIMVFDGCNLPSKKKTEAKRRESKEQNRKKAAQCLIDGKRAEAREYFQRCIDVTQKMAHEVIRALHDLGVDVIVAPYEADAQLTYLNKINIAQYIITEDSDLILFGCDKILYKLDLNGNAQLVHKNKIIQVTGFNCEDNFERFRWMCILSGCDYLENLPGIGLGKAKKLLNTTRKTNVEEILKLLPEVLKMPKLKITHDYIEQFKRADKTFKYQIVFDPLQKKLVSLHEYQFDVSDDEQLDFAGLFYDNTLAFQLALGNLDVNNKEKVDNFDPTQWKARVPSKYSKNPPPNMHSIWSSEFRVLNKDIKSFFINKSSCENVDCIQRPLSTKGMVKTLDVNILKSQRNSASKRKFDESPAKGNLELSGVFDQENVETPTNKKLKLHIKHNNNEIDEILNEYTSQVDASSNKSNSEATNSTYFSSNSIHDSPVRVKSSSQKLSTQKSSYISFHMLNDSSQEENKNECVPMKESSLSKQSNVPFSIEIIESQKREVPRKDLTTIFEDLNTLGRSSQAGQLLTQQKASESKKSINEQQSQKSIAELLTKFQFNKTRENKFVSQVNL